MRRGPGLSLIQGDSGRVPDRESPSGARRSTRVAVLAALVALLGFGIGKPAARGSGETGTTLKVGRAAARPAASAWCETLKDLTPKVRRQLEQGKTLVELESHPERRTKEGLVLRRVNASLAAVARVLKDHERLPDLVSTVRVAEITPPGEETLGKATIRVRQVLDLPFPLRNRRYTIEISTTTSEDCFESSWRYVEGSGNIRSSVGRWEVLRQSPRAALIAYVIHTDPGGLIPGWAADWASRRALPEVVESIGAAAEAEAPLSSP